MSAKPKTIRIRKSTRPPERYRGHVGRARRDAAPQLRLLACGRPRAASEQKQGQGPDAAERAIARDCPWIQEGMSGTRLLDRSGRLAPSVSARSRSSASLLK